MASPSVAHSVTIVTLPSQVAARNWHGEAGRPRPVDEAAPAQSVHGCGHRTPSPVVAHLKIQLSQARNRAGRHYSAALGGIGRKRSPIGDLRTQNRQEQTRRPPLGNWSRRAPFPECNLHVMPLDPSGGGPTSGPICCRTPPKSKSQPWLTDEATARRLANRFTELQTTRPSPFPAAPKKVPKLTANLIPPSLCPTFVYPSRRARAAQAAPWPQCQLRAQ